MQVKIGLSHLDPQNMTEHMHVLFSTVGATVAVFFQSVNEPHPICKYSFLERNSIDKKYSLFGKEHC